MNRLERMTVVLLVTFLAAACATMPDTPPVASRNWSGSATAEPGFTGAGANAAAVSGATGTAITVAFREATGMNQTVRPWHLHYGSCGNDQGLVGDMNLYAPLRPGADGTATATATVPLTLDASRSYFINIHKSPSETTTIVACGALNPGSNTSTATGY